MRKASDQKGMAMILVLCVMALLTALCLSLVYGAAQISSNAEKRIDQIQAHELAVSLSDTIRDSATGLGVDKDGKLYQFLQTFLTSESYAYLHDYTADLSEASLPEGCKSIRVSFKKSKIEVPETLPTSMEKSEVYWINKNDNNGFGFLDITVEVETKYATDSVTYHYDCRPDYSKMSYFYTSKTVLSFVKLDYKNKSYYLSGTEDQLKFVSTNDSDPVEQTVNDDTVNQNTGVVSDSNDGMQIHCGFETRVEYLLDWYGMI